MPTYLLRRVSSDLIRRAKARAKTKGESLDEHLIAYLTAYADEDTAADRAQRGGHARAAKLSPDERRRIAQHAAQTRWASTR